MTADLIQLYADANIRIAKLERDLSWYKHEWERLDDRNDALEVENAQLRKTLADTTHL